VDQVEQQPEDLRLQVDLLPPTQKPMLPFAEFEVKILGIRLSGSTAKELSDSASFP
jgi:hypothetical protein